jgi:MarR family 2-MHQ and catechol resistance regulon transcriptional repressor
MTTEIMNSSMAADLDRRQASTLKLWVVLARAYAAIEAQAAADIGRHGLTLTEFGILEALYHKGPMLLGEVQRKVLVSSGGITYLVDRLEAQGLVKRQPSPEDRRARYAALTRKGEQLIRRVFPEHARRLTQVLGGLNEGEKREAFALLRKLGLGVARAEPGDTIAG